jgi:class 3 adenylate cyclase
VAEVRRLAAILAADVVGYSRMMGEDEAGTARAVRERREAAVPILAAHGGRLFKTMGDGMLIEFPSIVSAVECALALQKQMAERNAESASGKSILYRIGVHVGDVLIEGDDLLGDGVNIAARLEAVAEPGGVCISGAGFDHVRGRIEAEFVDLGAKTLKNIARLVQIYAVVPTRNTSPPLAPEGTGPPRLSLVVLPFANIGGGAEHDYFADGVTESLTTDLSRIRGLLSSPAIPPSPTRGRRSTCARLGAISMCATRSRAASSAAASGCASTFSWSTRRLALIFGPSGSTRRSLTFSTCKTRSSLG